MIDDSVGLIMDTLYVYGMEYGRVSCRYIMYDNTFADLQISAAKEQFCTEMQRCNFFATCHLLFLNKPYVRRQYRIWNGEKMFYLYRGPEHLLACKQLSRCGCSV